MASDSALATNARARGLVFGLTAVLLWAGFIVYARAGVTAGLLTEDLLLARYGPAALLMLPVLLRPVLAAKLVALGWRRAGLLALVGGLPFMALGVSGYFFAPLSHGAVLQPASITLVGFLLAWVVLGERPGRFRAIGTALVLVGLAATASITGSGPAAQSWLGDLCFIAAGSLWAIFTILLKRWETDPIVATAAVSLLSAALILPFYLLRFGLERLTTLDAAVIVTQALVQGVFAGVLAVIAYAKAVALLGAGRASLLPALLPGVAVALGIPVTSEYPTVLQITAILLVTVGLGIETIPRN